MIRAIILSATLAALFAMWRDRPTPVQTVQVDYCPINFKGAYKDEMGTWRFVWASTYGPCYLQDEYREI